MTPPSPDVVVAYTNTVVLWVGFAEINTDACTALGTKQLVLRFGVELK